MTDRASSSQDRQVSQRPDEQNESQEGACCSSGVDRRRFIQIAGAGAAALSATTAPPQAIAGPFTPEDTADHFVPVDKKLKPDWVRSLTDRGQREWYSGTDLETIGMPIGGICAGQLYLCGDGRLAHWDIFNHRTAGYGYPRERRAPATPVEQGFAVRIKTGDKTVARPLDCRGFPGVRFCGEYPIGYVEYAADDVPVSIGLEAFSPFIPLNAPDSALPATVMEFTIKNNGSQPAEVTLAGGLENAVCAFSGATSLGTRINRVLHGKGAVMLLSKARPIKPPEQQEEREPKVLADFEGGDYTGWTVEGEAFGKKPAGGTLARQQEVRGFMGKGLVNTFLGGDPPHGKLTSKPFTIDRRFISFLIGGGGHENQTCINLVVDGKVARTATGENDETLKPQSWNVADLAGKEARIEIVDAASGAWGHINIDQIELRDKPRVAADVKLEEAHDFGTMGLAVLGGEGKGVTACTALPDGELTDALLAAWAEGSDEPVERPFGTALRGGLAKTVTVAPGGEGRIAFVVAWHFPNRPNGHFYATRFADAPAVVAYIAENFDRLAGHTRLWHDTYYDSTLPYWLLDRMHATVSVLASETSQWWANGRFWAFEGVRCCRGTCGHVWNYAHAPARLFPRLERSVREMQDFAPGVGFITETGEIRFRGENWGIWAGDSQGGYLLKALREHQCSADDAFLRRNWPNIRKALEFLIVQDANDDGLIEGQQHNTYDINYYGANTMVGSLYLGALRAGEEMAREMGDEEFAGTCRKIFESGRRLTAERLFNGEYFIQDVDLEKHPKHQYGDGCLSDQLFGQGWAHQVGLGYIYPTEDVLSALKAVWIYNWAPDIGPQNEAHKPRRWFAYPGEAGLFTCTWPKSKHLGPESTLYRNEVWTGIEYQVAGHMAWEGMITEAMAICRAAHDRYHPSKRNPWNEIECGDHYARSMAGWGVLTGLCGFEYHGPKRHAGMAPRISPDDFRAPFTAAEGWGTLRQKRDAKGQTSCFELKSGKLPLETLSFELPEDKTLRSTTVHLAGRETPAKATQDGRRVVVAFAEPVTVDMGQAIEVTMSY